MSTINERIKELMKHYGLNINSFSVKIGMTNNVAIGSIVNKPERKPSYEVIMKILNTFPEVSRKWFIEGVGDMLVSDIQKTKMSVDDVFSAAGEIKVIEFKPGDVLIVKCATNSIRKG